MGTCYLIFSRHNAIKNLYGNTNNNPGFHKFSSPPSNALVLSSSSSRLTSIKMKPLIIFIALLISAVYSVPVEKEEGSSSFLEKSFESVGDPVEVTEVRKDQKSWEKHEAVGLPLEKTSKPASISDHPVEELKLKDEEKVLLDSIRDELTEVAKELEDVKTHLSESEDVEGDLSQSDPKGMLFFRSSFRLAFIFFQFNSAKV